MAYSRKSYAETNFITKKFVNAPEGEAIYGISRNRFIELAKRAEAFYKVRNSALVNTEIFERYLERYRENPVPLPKHYVDKEKILRSQKQLKDK